MIVTSARGCRIENHVACCKTLTRNAVINEEEKTFLDVQFHLTHIGLFQCMNYILGKLAFFH